MLRAIIKIILYLSIFTHGLVYNFAGITLNGARISAVLLTMVLAMNVAVSGNHRKHDRLAVLLLVWLLISFVSSILSINPAVTLKGFIVLSLSVLFYVFVWQFKLFYNLTRDIHLLKWIGFMLGTGGAIFFLAGVVGIEFGHLNGLFLELHHGEVRVRMTMAEPNLYGAVMIWLSLLTVATFDKNKKGFSWLLLIATHVGLLVSFSRGPWGGYLIALCMYLLLTRDVSKGIASKRVTLGLIIVSVSLVISMLPDAGFYTLFENRLSTTFERTSSINARMIINELAWPDVVKHPIIGNGVFSFAVLHPLSGLLLGVTTEGAGWIAQMFYAILHDSGVIGLVCTLLFFYLLFFRSYKAVMKYRLTHGVDETLKLSTALLASAFGILVASQVTAAYSLAFFWVVMAFANEIPHALSVFDAEGGDENRR